MNKISEILLYFGSKVSPSHPSAGVLIIGVSILILYFFYIRYGRYLTKKIKNKRFKSYKPLEL